MEKKIQRQNAFYYVISYMPFDSSVFRLCAAAVHGHQYTRSASYTVRALVTKHRASVFTAKYINQWSWLSVDSTLCTKFCFDHIGSYVFPIQCADNVCSERIARRAAHKTMA